MQKIDLILKNEKQKFYNRLTVFILLFNTAAIAWLLFSLHQSPAGKVFAIIAPTLLMATLFLFMFRKKYKQNDSLFLTATLATFIYWILSGYWWMGIIVAILSSLYFINKRKLIVRFYPDKIEYPSFPKRIIQWNELTNVILKDDWLTLDFKNNRIIQQFTEESATAGNEKEFNDFCRQLLNK